MATASTQPATHAPPHAAARSLATTATPDAATSSTVAPSGSSSSTCSSAANAATPAAATAASPSAASSPASPSSPPSPSPSSPSSAPPPSGPSSSAPEPPLEGTPIPWALLVPAPLPAACTSTTTSPGAQGSSPNSPGGASSSSGGGAASGGASSSTSGAAAGAAGVGASGAAGGPQALELILQRLRIGSATFRLVAPRDVDAVMDMYFDRGLLDADPYWTRAWPSAIALAATLLARPELVAGRVVADLGAGLGLAGIAAALAGAREVVLLDREPLALQCGLLSAAATGLDSGSEYDLLAGPSGGSTATACEADPAVAAPWPGPGSAADAAAAAASRNPQHRRRAGGGGIVEPLPYDQAPAYARLRLAAPYGNAGGGGAADAAAAAAAAMGSGAPEAQAEWRTLMAHARALAPAPPAGEADTEAGGAPGSEHSANGANDGGAHSVLRGHVFDWTAPPEMASLLPPLAPPPSQAQQHGGQQQQQRRGTTAAAAAARQRRFDVVLACDVLYEEGAVGPIAALLPQLLRPDGGRLLLADPPNRTVHNREAFLEKLRNGPLRLAVEECSLQQCEVSKLDNEMAGGLGPSAETVPVQFLVFRSCVGNDTVGLKL